MMEIIRNYKNWALCVQCIRGRRLNLPREPLISGQIKWPDGTYLNSKLHIIHIHRKGFFYCTTEPVSDQLRWSRQPTPRQPTPPRPPPADSTFLILLKCQYQSLPKNVCQTRSSQFQVRSSKIVDRTNCLHRYGGMSPRGGRDNQASTKLRPVLLVLLSKLNCS